MYSLAQSAVRCGAVRCVAVQYSHHAGSSGAQHMQFGGHAGLFARVAGGRAAKAREEWQRRLLQRGGVHWEHTWRAVEADVAAGRAQMVEFH